MSSGTAPDSICPRGWMMAEYSGNKSYNNLIIDVYGRSTISSTLNRMDADTSLLHLPLSFLHSGHYYNSNVAWNGRNTHGFYWESDINSNANAYYLRLYLTDLIPQYSATRDLGLTLRCVSRTNLLATARKYSEISYALKIIFSLLFYLEE